MLKFGQLVTAFLISLMIPASGALADPPPPLPPDPVLREDLRTAVDATLNAMQEKLNGSLDVKFMYETRREADSVIAVARHWNSESRSAQFDSQRAWDLFYTVAPDLQPFGSFTTIATPQSYPEFISSLITHGREMTTQGKLFYLSLLGERLYSRYNKQTSRSTKNEEVFESLVTGGASGNGGRCGDIATFLKDAALALGFKDAGTTSGKYTTGNRATGHIVAWYVGDDGKYIIQNYNQIYFTGMNDPYSAINMAQSVMGGNAMLSRFDPAGANSVLVIPITARWVKGVLDGPTFEVNTSRPYSLKNIDLSVRASNVRQGFRLSSEGRIAGDSESNLGLRTFVTADEYLSREGPYRVAAVGAAVSGNQDIPTSLLDDLDLSFRFATGALVTDRPGVRYRNSDLTEHRESNTEFNLFYDLAVKARATLGDFEAEIRARAQDVAVGFEALEGGANPLPISTIPYIDGAATVRWNPGHGPLTVEAEQAMELRWRNMFADGADLGTKWQALGLRYDLRDDSRGLYLKMKGKLYRMDDEAAWAASATVTAGIRRGIVSVEFIGEASDFLANGSGNPIYDNNEFYRAGITAGLDLSRNCRAEASVEWRRGRKYFGFDEPGDSIVPELFESDRDQCLIGIGLSFYR